MIPTPQSVFSTILTNTGRVANTIASGVKADIIALIESATSNATSALATASAAVSAAVTAGTNAVNANILATTSQANVTTAISNNADANILSALYIKANNDIQAAKIAATDAEALALVAQEASANASSAAVAAQSIIREASSVVEVSPYAVLNQGTPAGAIGFSDPSGKYPLKSHDGESDTPRLASCQNLMSTIVSEKTDDQTLGVPIANSDVYWNQSAPAYNAEYPYNLVHQSESGHVIEIDDTKGSERINIHHMAGTFIEIDGESNLTNKIKGIRTIIVDADDLLYVSGSGHITIDGDMSVRVGGNCQIEVVGDANISVAGNLTQSVSGNMVLKVAGNYSQEVSGNSTYRVGGNCSTDVLGTGNYKFGILNQYSIGESNFNSGAKLNISTSADFNLSVGGNANQQSGGDSNTLVGGNGNIRASGNVNIDGSTLNLESGSANPPSVAPAPIVDSVPLQTAIPAYSPTIVTPSPVTKLESYTMELEGPDNISTRQVLLSGQTPIGNTPTSVKESISAATPIIPPIMTGCDFGNLSLDTQLSKNFTLNMLLGDSGRPFPFGIGQHGLTDANIVCNLRKLCINVLEPLRDKYSSIGFKINSGYRNAGKLSKKNISQHELGQAADISFTAIRGRKDQVEQFFNIAKEINAMRLPIDQLIFEVDPIKGYVWIHCSYNESAVLPRADGTGLMSYYGDKYIHNLELHV